MRKGPNTTRRAGLLLAPIAGSSSGISRVCRFRLLGRLRDSEGSGLIIGSRSVAPTVGLTLTRTSSEPRASNRATTGRHLHTDEGRNSRRRQGVLMSQRIKPYSSVGDGLGFVAYSPAQHLPHRETRSGTWPRTFKPSPSSHPDPVVERQKIGLGE